VARFVLRNTAPSAPFTPASLAGLAAWYDASDAASITSSGGAVSQWNDKSGNARHLVQATGSSQPITGTRTQNSLNVIDFTAVSQRIEVTGFTAITTNTATAFAVFQWETGSQNFARLWCLAPAGGDESFVTTGMCVAQRRASTTWAQAYNGAVAATAVIAQDTPALIASQRNGDAGSFWLNGGSASSTSGYGTSNFNIQDFYVATRFDHDTSNAPMDGWVAELILYSTALGATDRATVRDYLNAKWAVY
jgi:hypothetical protein